MEIIKNIRSRLQRFRRRNHQADLVEAPGGLLMYHFPNIADNVVGVDGFDLANAHLAGIVNRGDRLTIGIKPQTPDAPKTLVEVFYYRPGSIFLPQGKVGEHSFLTIGLDHPLELTINPLGWTKTEDSSPEKFIEAMKRVYGDLEIGYQIFAATDRQYLAQEQLKGDVIRPAAESVDILLQDIPKPDF